MGKKTMRRPRPTSSASELPVHLQSSVVRRRMVMGSITGLGPGKTLIQHKFFPKGHPIPVDLKLDFDGPLKGGNESGREQLNRPAVLIHAEDPAFRCCWFSRAIDLGDETGNPAFWMLQKTAVDTWFLCLRRVSGELAAYHLKSRTKKFPIKLKKGRTTKDFTWPASITIRQD